MADFAKPPSKTRRRVSIPYRGNRNNTKKSLSKSPNEQQQQQTPEDVDTKFEEYIRKRKQKADIRNYLKLRKIKSKTRSKTRSKTSSKSRSKSTQQNIYI
jgi:hypothetical protein